SSVLVFAVFFFQAEDGIRDFHVTGVQTCALPIFQERKQESNGRQRALAPRQGQQVLRPLAGQLDVHVDAAVLQQRQLRLAAAEQAPERLVEVSSHPPECLLEALLRQLVQAADGLLQVGRGSLQVFL